MHLMTLDPNGLAREVLKKYWDKKVPVDPVAISKALGAQIISDANLGAISGQYQFTEHGPVIRFNPNEPPVRQRFTIAHECGHYVLSHGNEFRDPSKNFSSSNFDLKEVAANRFAAALLMPEEGVRHFIEAEGISDIRALANKFFVSEAAMEYRLKNLGWIP